MFDIILTHEQQQKAVEQIQALMAKGVSSGEANPNCSKGDTRST